MKIAIGADHAGVELKKEIMQYVIDMGHEVKDFGTFTTESVDYPIYGEKVAREVASKNFDMGILVCGTGVGISIAANKVKGIRAVVCSEPVSAALSRAHNDTNVLALGARIVGSQMAKEIVSAWLKTEFEGGRHGKRVAMIDGI